MATEASMKVMRSQRRKKIFAIESFGGKCELCGYNKCINALEFHHLNKEEKQYDPSYIIMRWSWKRAYSELKKCILVCSNCHKEIHYNIREIKSILRVRVFLDKKCVVCSNPFVVRTDKATQRYCSVICKTLDSRKVSRPTRKQLEKMLESKFPWTRIGKIYGVSDNAVRKWAKKYNLI